MIIPCQWQLFYFVAQRMKHHPDGTIIIIFIYSCFFVLFIDSASFSNVPIIAMILQMTIDSLIRFTLAFRHRQMINPSIYPHTNICTYIYKYLHTIHIPLPHDAHLCNIPVTKMENDHPKAKNDQL